MSRLRVPSLHQRVYHRDDPSVSLPHVIPPQTPSYQNDVLPPYAISPAISPSRRKLRSSLHQHAESPALWLALYFALNLSLTLYNKTMLTHFPFPYTLTAMHALCGSIGTFILLRTTAKTQRYSGPGTARRTWRMMEGIPKLNKRETIVLLLFSVLYTVNIVLSNVSLRLVTVPFHQVVRALSPFFTILLSSVLLGQQTRRSKLIPLIPVVAGVGLATYGDYYFTPYGFFLTLLGTILASVKTVLTNLLQSSSPPSLLPSSPRSSASSLSPTPLPSRPPSRHETPLSTPSPYIRGPSPTPYIRGPSPTPYIHGPPSFPSSSTYSAALPFPTLPKLHLTSLQLLSLLSPLACIQSLLLAWLSGELESAQAHFSRGSQTQDAHHPFMALFSFFLNTKSSTHGAEEDRKMHMQALWLLLNGVLAFFLNVASFGANKRAGPLGMSVAANVKQVLTVLIAVTLFDLTITSMNALGIVLTLVGGAWYTQVELREKQQRKLASEKD